MIGSPYVLNGTLGQLRDLLERRRGRTEISYYAIRQGSMETMAPLVEALARQRVVRCAAGAPISMHPRLSPSGPAASPRSTNQQR